MKKRILGLVLALCMIVGLLPVVALAEDPITASVVITTGDKTTKVQWKPDLTEGMAPAYAKTTAEGTLVKEGSEADYNLKVEWPTSGKPTLTMKGATLTNDNIYPDKIDTVVIEGTADFVVKIDGTNVINGNPSNTSTTTSAYRCAIGILASNKGTLTIQGANKLNDTLTIDNKGGNGIVKKYNALTIDKCAVTIKCVNTSSNAQHGIVLVYEDAGLEDLCNLTVTSAKLDITAGKYHGNCAIMVSKTESTSTANVNANTGDILFKDSSIRLYRSNGSGSSQVTSSLVALGSGSTFTIDNCGVTMYSRHIIARYAPTLLNMKEATYTPENGKNTAWGFTAGDNIGTTKISSFTATHNCTEVAPDDSDCTTPPACVICGAAMGTAEAAHVPATDDNDCTTAVMCANTGCLQVAIPAGHIPGADDGDCTTAIKCLYCTADAVPANTHVFTDAADTTCDNEGCNHARIILTSTLVITTGDNTTPVKWNPTLSEGMAPAYAKTTAAGALVLDGATETDYNLKVEWTTGGKPTLTMKGATLVNETIYPDKIDTIVIGGNVDFIIKLSGTNAINGNPSNENKTDSAYRFPTGIEAANSGALTIQGATKADTLTINNKSGTGISKSKGNFVIETSTVNVITFNAGGSGVNAQHAIQVIGTDAGFTVRNAKLDCTIGGYHGNFAILLSNTSYKNDDSYMDANAGDILFQNSEIRLYRSNGTGSTQKGSALIQFGANSTFTIDRSDALINSRHIISRYAPAITNGTAVVKPESGTEAAWSYEAGANISTIKLTRLTVTHTCTAPADADCTTDDFCAVCGVALGNSATHTPAADDGDCTTAVMCANPGCAQIAIPAAAAHTPEADDGDCTTAIKCSVCGTETTPAAATHVGGTATCKDKAKCTTCGKEYGELLTTHVPNADDGDCTTAITCSICGTETTPAASHTGGTATCKDKAKCTNCGKEYGELRATHDPAPRTDCTVDTMCTTCGQVAIPAGTHIPEADDGNCTTAIKCSVCGTETTAAKANHTPEADDGDCTTAIKCTECGTVTTPAATHTGGTATCKEKAKCTTCGKEYGELLTTHVPNADDGDCTTEIICSICNAVTTPAATHTGGTATCKEKAKCATCGKEYGELLTTHVPAADDGDCTTAIKCSICEAETTAAKAAHTPEADDGDCTTAIKCADCDKVTTAAATHTGGTATCKAKAKCATCGKEYGELAAHTPAADDGDCTTAIKCTVCDAETTAAATHTGGTATCKAKAKCATCGKEYGELAAHTPAADDGDCTTAIKCTVCEAETTVAKTGHTYANDKDTTCDDPGCKATRTVTDNPKTGDISILLSAAVALTSAVGFAGMTVLRKKEN